MKFRVFLRTAREIKKLSLRDLEKQSGVSNVTISQIESGHVTRPAFLTIVKIAKALHIPTFKLAKMALDEEAAEAKTQKKET